MRSRIVGVAALILVGVLGAAYWYWRGEGQSAQAAIRGSGIIEVTQVDVAFEVPGRMIERYVDEGAMLDGGEPVARLDEREYKLQVERARAAKAAADAQYRLMVEGARAQDIDQALAALESAESALHLQQLEHARIAKLATTGIVSQNELDQVSAALTSAQKAREQAAARLDMLREGSRIEEIEAARGRAMQASAELELAELNLARCKLYAPMAGRVLSKSREPGEVVQAGTPIVTLGDLSRPWVNLYVGERDLGKVKLGMPAKVTIDSHPNEPFPGRVTFVADRAEFTPKNIQTPDERVKLVYRIKVEIETRDGMLKPGMPADTVLPLDQEHSPQGNTENTEARTDKN